MGLLTDIADFLLPRHCVMCGNRLASKEKGICSACLMSLPVTDFHLMEHSPVEQLFWEQFPVERGASMFYHDGGGARSLIHANKYRRRPDVGYWLARTYAKELQQSGFLEGVDAIVPVPLHWRRLLSRSYNQSAYIAQGISDETGIPILRNVLRRVRNNPSQTTVRGSQRKQNVEGIFRLTHPGRVEGKHLLLVDDVLTTGSTMLSCAKELAKAERVKISVLTLSVASQTPVPATGDE